MQTFVDNKSASLMFHPGFRLLNKKRFLISDFFDVDREATKSNVPQDILFMPAFESTALANM